MGCLAHWSTGFVIGAGADFFPFEGVAGAGSFRRNRDHRGLFDFTPGILQALPARGIILEKFVRSVLGVFRERSQAFARFTDGHNAARLRVDF